MSDQHALVATMADDLPLTPQERLEWNGLPPDVRVTALTLYKAAEWSGQFVTLGGCLDRARHIYAVASQNAEPAQPVIRPSVWQTGRRVE